MADYQIVKHCRWCRKRFVIDKSESKKNYCNGCQKKMDNEQKSS